VNLFVFLLSKHKQLSNYFTKKIIIMRFIAFAKQLALVTVVVTGIAVTFSSCHRGSGCPGHITQVEESAENIC
jgi:hypothetical protein